VSATLAGKGEKKEGALVEKSLASGREQGEEGRKPWERTAEGFSGRGERPHAVGKNHRRREKRVGLRRGKKGGTSQGTERGGQRKAEIKTREENCPLGEREERQ